MKNELIYKTAKQLFVKYGIKKTSLEMIARECGISRMTIYRKFTDKEDMIEKAIDFIFISLGEKLEQYEVTKETDVQEYLNFISTVLTKNLKIQKPEFLKELKLLYPHIFQKVIHYQQKLGKKYFSKILAAAENQHTIRKEVTPELLQLLTESMLIKVPEHSLFEKIGYTPDQLFTIINNIILFGILEK